MIAARSNIYTDTGYRAQTGAQEEIKLSDRYVDILLKRTQDLGVLESTSRGNQEGLQ